MRDEARQEIHIKILEIRDLIRKEIPEAKMDDLDIDISIIDHCVDGYTKLEASIDGSVMDYDRMAFTDDDYFKKEAKVWN